MSNRSVRILVDIVTAQAEAASDRLGTSVRRLQATFVETSAAVSAAEKDMAAATGRSSAEQSAATDRVIASNRALRESQAATAQMARVQAAAIADNARRDAAAATGAAAATAARADEAAAERRVLAYKRVGKAATEMGTVLTAAFAVSVYEEQKFEKTISATGAITGASVKQLDQMRQLALTLGKTSPFGATHVAEGMNELAKNGISVTNILHGAAKAAIDLAAANDAQLAPSAELVSNAMDAFALKAKQLPAIADSITGATHAGAGSLQDFSYALSNVGPVARLAGLSFDDTSVAIAEFGKNGIHGSQAGTGLKDMLLRLNPRSKEAADLMQELGIITADGANQFFDAQGKVKSFAEVQQVLANALRGMTNQQKIATLDTMFGLHAVQEASIAATLGADGFNKFAASVHRVTADEATRKRMDNLAGDVKKLGGSLQTTFIETGSRANSTMRELTQGVASGVRAFGNLPGPVQTAGVAIAGIGGPSLLLMGVVGSMIPKIREFRLSLEALGPAGMRANAALGMVGKTVAIGAVVGVAAYGLSELGKTIGNKLDPPTHLAAVDVDRLSSSLKSLGESGAVSGELMRAAGSSLSGFGKLVAQLNSSNSNPMHIFGTELTGRMKSFDTALAQLVKGGDLDNAEKAFQRLSDAAVRQGVPLSQLGKQFPLYMEAVKEAGDDAGKAAYGTGTLSEEATKLGASVLETKNALDEFDNDLKNFGKPISTEKALLSFNEGLLKLKDTLKGNKNSLDEHTQAGIDDKNAILDEIAAAQEHAKAMRAQGVSAEATRQALLDHRDALRQELLQSGLTEAAVNDLINTYYQIPDDVSTYIAAHGIDTATTQINELTIAIDAMPSRKDFTLAYHLEGYSAQSIRNITDPSRAFATGGINVRPFAAGGISFESGGMISAAQGYAQIASPGTLYRWAEPSTMGEAFIPFNPGGRGRAEGILSRVAHIFGGQYTPANAVRAASAAGAGAAPAGPLVAQLAAEDRALLRAVASRDAVVKVGERELARATQNGTRTNNRRNGR